MLLIGHEAIAFKPFYHIHAYEDIAKTPSNSTVLFDFHINLAHTCAQENIPFALHVKQIKELMFAHALNASYFVLTKDLALQAQKIADDYLFDGKILLLSNDENDIEFAALHGIDGILFEAGIQVCK
ncbi:hypothetical protein [Sulfurospirillum barnesii]|uniref:Uncharacterized protein n=1 Tax=Sulfurospirillum barnesii (strain ATCC 700032 / DSM 10660 / SES-3) TaxID=760154 RepID=I3XUW4_SULBS|nr:hypothetical protein [Sulfurospirillum barnesii]AFL67738.1 hypothetical protein Sulba_0420 [Sulfurospirillum barnesii SES-3]